MPSFVVHQLDCPVWIRVECDFEGQALAKTVDFLNNIEPATGPGIVRISGEWAGEIDGYDYQIEDEAE